MAAFILVSYFVVVNYATYQNFLGPRGYLVPALWKVQGLSCRRRWHTEWLLEVIKAIINISGCPKIDSVWDWKENDYNVYALTLVFSSEPIFSASMVLSMNLVFCCRNHLLFSPATHLKRQSRSFPAFLSYMPFLCWQSHILFYQPDENNWVFIFTPFAPLMPPHFAPCECRLCNFCLFISSHYVDHTPLLPRALKSFSLQEAR